jgi:hypothetical protein
MARRLHGLPAQNAARGAGGNDLRPSGDAVARGGSCGPGQPGAAGPRRWAESPYCWSSFVEARTFWMTSLKYGFSLRLA